jgi:rhodanese-related sulfurtransferase
MTHRTTIHELLADARARLDRLGPAEALAWVQRGDAVLVDIRADSQRERDGVIPGARYIPRNVLEWRLDPASGYCDPALADLDRHVILVCDEGYQSSLAAATLQDLGLHRATDLEGGFQAWRAAGLPVTPAGPARRTRAS